MRTLVASIRSYKMRTVLFIDFQKHPLTERQTLIGLARAFMPAHEFTIINFFTSNLEDLAVISKHRIVSLPTFLGLDPKNKVQMRYLGIPSQQVFEGIQATA